MSHVQHAPPFPLEGAAAGACDCSGGCLAVVVEARHVATLERVDAVAWALLTLHAHIDLHVKRFKASLHPRASHLWEYPVHITPVMLQ